MEEWRAVTVHPFADLYQVSSFGRIKKLPYVDKNGRRHKEMLHQPGHDWTGDYFAITLRLPDGTNRKARVHKLVAAAFLGACPAGLEVCHNNSNPLDNRAENLRYDTRKGNFADKYKVGTDNRGERHGMAKLTEHSVQSIRTLRKGGASLDNISWLFGVTEGTVSGIVHRRRWRHL